jgi:hypothetical protein
MDFWNLAHVRLSTSPKNMGSSASPNDASDHLTASELLFESQGENPVIVCR